MAESSRYAFPFQNKIEMEAEIEHPEEVPLQEIVFKNIQNFTREDFDQAKKDLENTKDGEVKGFKYTYFSPEQKKSEEPQLQTETINVQKSPKEEEKEALRSPAFLSVNLDLSNEPKTSTYSASNEERSSLPAHPIEQKAELPRRLPKQLKPIVRHKKTPSEEDLRDETGSFLISHFR